MKPTQILMDEHRVIEQVLAVLGRMIQRAEAGGTLDLEHAREAVEFFRNFADRCHHAKEETHLFPLLEAHGFPREGGPTGVMLHEHELGRAHVKAMAESIDSAAAGDSNALQRWIQHARAYIELLTQHIQKEDECLYPMADRALGDAEQAELAKRFAHVEHEELGAGTHERYLGIADTLAIAYGVAPVARGTPTGGGCGCHRQGHSQG